MLPLSISFNCSKGASEAKISEGKVAATLELEPAADMRSAEAFTRPLPQKANANSDPESVVEDVDLVAET